MSEESWFPLLNQKDKESHWGLDTMSSYSPSELKWSGLFLHGSLKLQRPSPSLSKTEVSHHHHPSLIPVSSSLPSIFCLTPSSPFPHPHLPIPLIRILTQVKPLFA